MSTKAWKRVRRALKSRAAELDARKRLARKVPRWRKTAMALGFPGFVRRWLERWERHHLESMRRALKKTTHFVREVGARPTAPRKYHMRPAQPAPVVVEERKSKRERRRSDRYLRAAGLMRDDGRHDTLRERAGED